MNNSIFLQDKLQTNEAANLSIIKTTLQFINHTGKDVTYYADQFRSYEIPFALTPVAHTRSIPAKILATPHGCC